MVSPFGYGKHININIKIMSEELYYIDIPVTVLLHPLERPDLVLEIEQHFLREPSEQIVNS